MQQETGQPFFSIIMPVYNVEKYIERAIGSILDQTWKDWELIVVDDCTPDESGRIARELAGTDERIFVVRHEENKGLSAARNTGKALAGGKYIWFMDSDDYVDSDLLENVYRSVEKHPAKLVVFGLIEEYFQKNGEFGYSHEVKPKPGYFSKAEDLRKEIIYLEQETLYGYAWNKMYDLEYLKTLTLDYENVKLIEDILFNVKYCMDIDSMNLLDIAPYHYQKRLDDSLTNKFVPDYYKLHKQRIDRIYKQYQYWDACTEEVRGILGGLYARYILSALQRNCDPRAEMCMRKRVYWCKKVFQERLYQELIPWAKANDSRALTLTLFFMKRKCLSGCLLLGRVVYMIKNKLPMIYSKVKSER